LSGRQVLAAALLAAAGAGACATAPAGPPASTASATPAPSLAGTLPRACTALPDAEFRARLAGGVDRELQWRGAELECEGMARPDGRGVRVVFAGRAGDERLTFVFGIPRLAEGDSGTGVPVNVTVIRDGRGVYGTQGEDRCTLDSVRQAPLDAVEPPPREAAEPRRWRIEARGFCLEPARAVAGETNDAILVATFDFVGVLTWLHSPADSAASAPRS
jgi:hypothetical protein